LTSKSCRSEIRVRASEPAAKSIYLALSPDMKKLEGTGERLALSRKGSSIIFKVETDDIASLRANINSYLRLVDASHRCIESSL
jgi:KEOPS complex subunit Pcc1